MYAFLTVYFLQRLPIWYSSQITCRFATVPVYGFKYVASGRINLVHFVY